MCRGPQIAYAEGTEFRIAGGGTNIWADGVDGSTIIETKFVGSAQSPYIPGSGVPDFIQAKIDAQQASEMSRYAAIINDGSTGYTDLRVVTNSNAAVPYFDNLMSEYGVPGEVVVRPAP